VILGGMGQATDLVLRGIALFNERRFDEALADTAPDIEWRTGLQPLLGLEVSRGVNEVREFWREAADGWEDFRLVPLDAEELDPETVLITLRYHGRGRVSGVVFDNETTSIYRLRDGRICSVRDYPSRDVALAALEEQR
jgi:ketosteroid isomerase-like protein